MNKQSKHPESWPAKAGQHRRTLLLSAVSAGLIGKTWLRPVVDSVILPAHASTTENASTEYFADVSSHIQLIAAVRALLCVSVIDDTYIGKLAVTFNDGRTDIFTSPETLLGEVSSMTGLCQDGGPFLASTPDAQSITVAFQENTNFTIPRAACALPVANC